MERLIPTGNAMVKSALTRRYDRGFTYVGVLVILMVMLMAMGAASQVWHGVMQRENEQELLFIGHQFRNAIGKYYEQSGNRYPPSLEALLEAGDVGARKVRFLRRVYRDPMTGGTAWGLVLGPDARITGVYSRSDEKPYKTDGFREVDAKFLKSEKYSDWKFIYVPKVVTLKPGGGLVNGIVRPVPRIR